MITLGFPVVASNLSILIRWASGRWPEASEASDLSSALRAAVALFALKSRRSISRLTVFPPFCAGCRAVPYRARPSPSPTWLPGRRTENRGCCSAGTPPGAGVAEGLGYGKPGFPHGCVDGLRVGGLVAALPGVRPYETEQVGVKGQGELASGGVVHRPCRLSKKR